MAQHPGRAWSLVAGGAVVHPLGQAGRLGTSARSRPAARRRAWHELYRRHHYPGSPQGGGRGKKGIDSQGRDVREALGRSRGGWGTKACVIADGRGRAIAFALAPGQAHELPLAPGRLGCLPDVPGWIVGDRGFASDALRERIWNLGTPPAIPPRHPAPAHRRARRLPGVDLQQPPSRREPLGAAQTMARRCHTLRQNRQRELALQEPRLRGRYCPGLPRWANRPLPRPPPRRS